MKTHLQRLCIFGLYGAIQMLLLLFIYYYYYYVQTLCCLKN